MRVSTFSGCTRITGNCLIFRLKLSVASTQSVRSNSEESKKVNDWLALLQAPLGLYEILNGRFGESNNNLASREASFFRCLSDPAVERSICVLTAAACDLHDKIHI